MPNASLSIDGTEVISKVSGTITQTFPGPNHTFTVKAENSAIVGANYNTSDNATSDQLAIYNGSTKLWGINESGWVQQPNVPAFRAYGTNNGTQEFFNVYPTISYNIGGHYSNTTGKFTVPIDGVYCIGFTNIGNNTADIFRSYLYVNGSVLEGDTHLRIDTNATGSEFGTNGMYTITLYLYAGDYVQTYHATDSTNTFYPSAADDDNNYWQFWGFLVG